MKRTDELLKERETHVPRGPFNAHPVFVERAEGARIYDVDGREYIDFAGGIGVCNAGHCNPAVVEAIRDQAGRYVHACFHVAMYEPYVALAKRLNGLAPGSFPKKTMLANSGAEAVENAVKVARHATGRPSLIAFENAFHGRTFLSLTLTSKVMPYKHGFGPLFPEVYRLPYAYCYRCAYNLAYPSCGLHCVEAIRGLFKAQVPAEQVAAVIVEPVLGEGGFVVPPPDYFRALQGVCGEHGIVLIVDEIQSGFGRTGRMFAIEHFGAEPDIIVTAKSIAGGLPLSGVTGRAELMDHPQPGGLGGTFGGNPLACRGALAVIDYIESHGLLRRAMEIGDHVKSEFTRMREAFPVIGDVRGLGAMVGMELVTDRSSKEPATEFTKQLIARCREGGLLMISAGTHSNVVRTLMPLTITDEELERGLSVIESSLRAQLRDSPL